MPNLPYVANTGRLADLIRQRGRDQAEGYLRGGEIQANLWGNLGNLITNTFQNYQREKQEAPIRARQAEAAELTLANQRREAEQVQRQAQQDQQFSALLAMTPTGLPDPREVVSIYGPQRGAAIAQGLSAFGEIQQGQVKNARDTAGRLVVAMEHLSPEMQATLWPSVRAAAITGGLGSEEQIPGQYSSQFGKAIFSWATGKGPEQPESFTLSEGQTRFGPDGTPIANVAKPVETPKPPAVGSFEDYVTRRFGTTPTPAQITQARKDYQQSDDRPRISITTESGLSPTMEANIINRLSTQWRTVGESARELDRQIGLMDAGLAAAKRGDMAQGAQTLLVTFQKILDPTSVVRESEYERSAAGQSLINRVAGAAERLVSGGAGISLAEMEKFATLAREAAAVQKQNLPAAQERLGRTADRYKIPRDLIFDMPVTPATLATPAAPTISDPYEAYLQRIGGGGASR